MSSKWLVFIAFASQGLLFGLQLGAASHVFLHTAQKASVFWGAAVGTISGALIGKFMWDREGKNNRVV